MDYRRLSKFCSLVLRHAPHDFGLDPDERGAVPLADLLDVVRGVRRHAEATADDLREMVRTSDKQRYELYPAEGEQPERIRARYGHSYQQVEYEPATPPAELWHGTGSAALEAILADGLKPMSRQYVHLTDDVEIARLVGQRHKGKLTLLRVDATAAHAAGVVFHNPGPRVFLCGPLAATFLAVRDAPTE